MYKRQVQYHGQIRPSYALEAPIFLVLSRHHGRIKLGNFPAVPTVSAQCFTALKLMMMGSRYHICTILVLVARACPCPYFLVEVVPRGEIFINPSDPKHVA